MEKLVDLLAMGEYGVYVWPSFVVAALVLLVMIAVSFRSLKRAQKALAALQATHETQ